MKVISIIAVLIAASSQICSTFAQVANPDVATTSDGRAVNINVILNDFTAAGVPATSATVVTVSTPPVIMSGNGVTGAGTATTFRAAGGTITYSPVLGFVGTIMFNYTIPITGIARDFIKNMITGTSQAAMGSSGFILGASTLTGTVTVTVVAEETRPDFLAGNQINSADAVETVNLSNLRTASFNNDAIEAIRLAALGGV
jgi:hypothetical protein